MKKRNALTAPARLLTLLAATVLAPNLYASNAAAQGSLAIRELGPPGSAIPVLSWSWGSRNSGSFHGGGGGGAGKANFQDLTFTKLFDRNTPSILHFVATGDHFENVVLRWGPATIAMTKVLVTSYEVDSEKMQEKITLNFVKVDVMAQDASMTFCWDVAENTRC